MNQSKKTIYEGMLERHPLYEEEKDDLRFDEALRINKLASSKLDALHLGYCLGLRRGLDKAREIQKALNPKEHDQELNKG